MITDKKNYELHFDEDGKIFNWRPFMWCCCWGSLFFCHFLCSVLYSSLFLFQINNVNSRKKSKIIEISKNYFTIRISRFFNSNFTCCILFNSWCMLKFHFNYPSEEKVYDSDEKNKFQRNTSHIERELLTRCEMRWPSQN